MPRKLRRIKHHGTKKKPALNLGAGLTTYANVTDEELCRLFRVHEHPLVEELVSRLGGMLGENSALADELKEELDATEGEASSLLVWGEKLETVILTFVRKELDADDEDDRPTIEDLAKAFEAVGKPEEAKWHEK